MKIENLASLVVAAALAGCAAAPPKAVLTQLDLGPNAPDPFGTDKSANLPEDALRALVESKVYLSEGARVGVLQVTSHYELEGQTTSSGVPAELNHSLEQSGLFETTTEAASDWPSESGIAGLRQIAARYRASYLLLYRERFAHKTWWNGWGWFAPTVVGALVAPNQTLASDGVLEATLLDVRNGTLLFTVFERVHATRNENVWNDDLKMEALERQLAAEAASRLSEQVVAKVRHLAVLRPAQPSPKT